MKKLCACGCGEEFEPPKYRPEKAFVNSAHANRQPRNRGRKKLHRHTAGRGRGEKYQALSW